MEGHQLFRLLGNEANYKILQHLCTSHVTSAKAIRAHVQSLTQPTISYHLRLLREANLVYFLPDGPCHYYYCRNPVQITELMAIAKETIRDESVFIVEREQLV